MQKNLLLIGACVFALTRPAAAQMMNKDSLSLVNKITQDKDKLAKLQATLPDVTKAKETTAIQAQQSADDNRTAANRLASDPQDKKLAKKAHNAAGDARDDAKKARQAASKLEDTNKDIRNLTERIAKNETKLNKYVVERKNLEAAPTVMIPKDSVQH